MTLKLVLLMVYKNGRGHNFRRQVYYKVDVYSGDFSNASISFLERILNLIGLLGPIADPGGVYAAPVPCTITNSCLV